MDVRDYAKAIVGALVAFLGPIGVGLTAGSVGGTALTGEEWVSAAIAGLVALGVVWAVPNRTDG